ncbi:MAG: type III-A CRISPR-associated RAMP protein Csm3 [Deltaproteobacteria bacterium]|nr:type III-A CRISPR-associated RAMP protein Csm3 [Deltaproteobacteria bacterium]
MKLENIQPINGTLTLISGLHIGAGDTEMRIGGTDSPVATHPHTGLPYIPGSSLKGKIRALLELRSGLMAQTEGSPVSAGLLDRLQGEERKKALRILQLFGTSGADNEAAAEVGPTRASFADSFINEACRQEIVEGNLPFTEVKAENRIDRIKGVARDPRFIERVPAGIRFDFSISLKRMEGDDDLLGLLLEGCRLLELDALGGSGSRGYGRVKFTFNNQEIQQRFDTIQAL